MNEYTRMRTVIAAKDVTQEDLDEALSIVEGWYNEGRIDWDDVWERMERYSDLDLGPEMDSPAMRKMQRYVRAERQN